LLSREKTTLYVNRQFRDKIYITSKQEKVASVDPYVSERMVHDDMRESIRHL
jgi:hypothetical protein